MKTNTLFPKLIIAVLLLIVSGTKALAQHDSDELIRLLLRKKLIAQSDADSLYAKEKQQSRQDETNEKENKKHGGKVWGLVYADAIYKAHADSAKRGNLQYSAQSKDSSGFDFRRIYLGYNFAISGRFATEFILSNESETDVLPSGNRSVFVKSANLRWRNIFPLADLVIGLAATPTLTYVGDREGAVWSYRSVERSISDQRKMGLSSDAGVLLQGKFNKQETFGYNFMLGNGSGAKPENDKFKKFYAEIYGRFWNKHLLFDLYGDYERGRLSPYQQAKTTFKATLAFQARGFTLGAELVQQGQQNNTIYTEAKAGEPNAIGTKKDTVSALAFGVSVFSIATILKEKLLIFARCDYFNPDLMFSNKNFYGSAYTGNTVQKYFTAGLDYLPESNIHIIPNIWYDGFLAASDAYNNVRPLSLFHQDYDLVYRITVSYVFNR